MSAARTKPYLNGISNQDLEQYRKFVDWEIVRCADKDLLYWADEQAAITTERLGRQAIQALKRLPYSLTIT